MSRSPCGGVHLGDSSRIRSEPVMIISADDSVAEAAAAAIYAGDVAILRRLLAEHPWLATASADLNWVPPWENLTPLDAAIRDGADELLRWLRERGATSAATPRR